MPTIFEWIERFDFLRGFPATGFVLLAAVFVIIAWDWRLVIFSLLVQYMMAGLLFVEILDLRLAVVKLLVGFFVCLIFYITGRQVNWGRLPVDVTPAEVARFRYETRIKVGPFLLPTSMPLRALLTAAMLLAILYLVQRPVYLLPAVESVFMQLAIYGLGGLGLLGMALSSEPLKVGMGILTFLMGFELFFSGLEQSLSLLISLAFVHLMMAVIIAYMTQARYAVTILRELR